MLHYHYCVAVFLQQDVRAGLYKCTGERYYDVEAAQNGMIFERIWDLAKVFQKWRDLRNIIANKHQNVLGEM